MTCPRPVHAGTSYMITRRCNDRQFLMHPCALVNEIVIYALAVAQKKYGILIHTVCVMSNHWHADITDLFGNLPDFCRDVHTTIARCINRSLGRKGPVFEAKQTHRLELAAPEDHIHWASYVIANPVAAGLVSSPEEWPGLISTSFDQKWEVKRPEYYFGKGSELPEVATLEMSRPPILEDISSEKIQGMIDDAVAKRVESKKAQMREKGEKFAGVDAVLNTPSSKKATSEEPLGAMIPRIAAKDKKLRIKLIKMAKEWLRSYREALKSWTDGHRETVFPAGTFAMQRQFRVTVTTPLLEIG